MGGDILSIMWQARQRGSNWPRFLLERTGKDFFKQRLKFNCQKEQQGCKAVGVVDSKQGIRQGSNLKKDYWLPRAKTEGEVFEAFIGIMGSESKRDPFSHGTEFIYMVSRKNFLRPEGSYLTEPT